jgi:serine/threonine protein kinase
MIEVGAVLHETYRIVRVIGAGGMGSVYEAQHVRLPKHFAIKVLHTEVLKNQQAFARFRREAEISSSIGHPNIIEVQDFNEESGQPYIVMEYLEGEDLRIDA